MHFYVCVEFSIEGTWYFGLGFWCFGVGSLWKLCHWNLIGVGCVARLFVE